MNISNSPSEKSEHVPRTLGFWHAPIRYLFGYDIFISYARADAHAYADSLQTKLEALGFAAFLDKHEIDPGDKLDETLARAIRRSRQFILLDTPTARKSPWVTGEVETYLRSKRPRLTRIIRKPGEQEASGSAWPNDEISKRLEGYVWAEDTAQAFATGKPGDEVIQQIRNNFRTVRLRILMRISVAMVIAGLSGLLIWSLIQTMAARKAARIATSRELVSRSLLDEQVNPELSILLAMYAVATTWSSDHLVLPEAEGQLHRAILSSHVRLTMSESSAIEAVAWSPDGNWLATGTEDGRLQLWNAATGKERLTRRAHDNVITSISWSSDSQRLATGSEDQTVKIWDRSGTEVRRLAPDKGRVNSVARDPDGRRLAAGCWFGHVKIWDASTGGELATLVAGEGYIASLAWNPDGERIALGDGGGEISVWSVRTKRQKLSFIGHERTVWGIAWDKKGKRLASASRDGNVSVWDGDTGTELVRMRGFFFTSVAWSPDSTRLAAGSRDQTAKIWDPENGTEILTIKGHAGYVMSVAWSPDGQKLATGSLDSTARIWDTNIGYELPPLKGHPSNVYYVDWTTDGKRLLTLGRFDHLRVWDASSSQELPSLEEAEARTNVVAHSDRSPDGRMLVSLDYGSHQGSIIDTTRNRSFVFRIDEALNSLQWSPDSKMLALGAEQQVSLLDIATQQLSTFKIDDGVSTIQWSPDSTRLAIGSPHGLRILPLATKQSSMFKVDDEVMAVQWSPDGTTLALGTWSGAVLLLDPKSKVQFRSLTRHSSLIRQFAWSPDRRRIASASADGTAKVWNADTGAELVTFNNHTGEVFSVAWSPDGKRLATASQDKTVQIYAMDMHDLIAIAHQRVTRDLTDEEVRNYLHTSRRPPLLN